MNLFVPYVGPSTNAMYAGQDWRRRIKHKSDAFKAVIVSLSKIKVRTNFINPVRIEIEPRLGKGRRSYDVSNYSYTYKLIEDCLVERGVLLNDSASFVKEVVFKSPSRGSETGVMFLITEIV